MALFCFGFFLPCFYCKASDVSSGELSAQDDRNKREERNEDVMKDQTVEDKSESWQRDRKVESSDWPRQRVCHTHERAIPIQDTVEALDITEEGKWKLALRKSHQLIKQR